LHKSKVSNKLTDGAVLLLAHSEKLRCCIYQFAFESVVSFAGGDVLGDKTAPTKTVEKFDWRMNCWTLVESMRERRRGCGACVLDNQIYVVGG